MDGSIERIPESLAVRALAARRERRRREDEPAFQLDAQGHEPLAPDPAAPAEPEPRPVAAPELDEPGAQLDVRG